MNIVINNIIDNDDELYNRVRAIGPGDGINRMMYVTEDAASIAAYGVREKVQEFPAVTTYSDLVTQADAYLASVSSPVKEIDFTYYFSGAITEEDVTFNGEIVTHSGSPVTQLMPGTALDLTRGDTVKVVSQSLGLSFTGVVDELDWSVGQVNVRLGQPYYNLVEVIQGPDRDRDRIDEALKLPAPIGAVATTGAPGVNVTINPYTNSRVVGTEVYADTTEGFTPDRSNLLLRSQDTKFEFPDLAGGVDYYFKLRSYDNQGNVSDFSTASATGGFIPTTKFKVGNVVIDDTGSSGGEANAVRVYDGTGFAAEDEVVRMGYINGLDAVPSGVNYGFWGTAGTNVFIKDSPRIVGIGFANFVISGGPYSGSTVTTGSVSIEASSFTVQTGFQRVYIFGYPYQEISLYGPLGVSNSWLQQTMQKSTDGGSSWSTYSSVISAGTYTSLDFRIEFTNFFLGSVGAFFRAPYFAFEINT